jgi:pimeloyl-ACP methyl ester carboxylesterase
MSEPLRDEPTFLSVGTGAQKREIAVLIREGQGTQMVWLGGFRSDMRATKATHLDEWAQQTKQPFVRFDYSGHGESGGDFRSGTISRWLEETCAVIEAFTQQPPLLIGSSMGGWLALLAARMLSEKSPDKKPCGLVLIAPAVDFTSELMWPRFSQKVKDEIMQKGEWLNPSAYSDAPYPITLNLIEDGKNHVMMNGLIKPQCPVHILQGVQDPDVPVTHAFKIFERLPADHTTLTLIKDGDHRLSRDEDLAVLVKCIELQISSFRAGDLK